MQIALSHELGQRSRPPPHVRDHLASGRRQNHAHREAPALRRRDPSGRRGPREGQSAATRPRTGWKSKSSAGSRSARACCSSNITARKSTCSILRATRTSREDTYRTLTAADAAVMLIDAAKGVEPQTRKLFEVCRMRGIPIFTFMNKLDRPSREIRSTCSTSSKKSWASAPAR